MGSSAFPIATCSGRWSLHTRALAAVYASSVAWLSRWSGARFSQVPTSGANRCEWSRRKEEASTTNTSTVGSSMAAMRGTSVLPADCACRPAAASIARVELGDRRLAVGACDRDERPLIPPRREIELGQHRHRSGRRGREQRVVIGHAGARHDGLGTGDELAERDGVRSLDQLDPELLGQRPAGRRRAIVDRHGPFAVRDQRSQHGLTGDAEAEHHVVGQSRPPVPMKSA